MPFDPLPPATILVVDDEEAILRLLSRFLTHIGYTVLEATSAERALASIRYREHPVDVVLTDVVMPGMDGVHLAAELLKECPGPSVLLMTGQLPDGVERLQVGTRIVPVLRKPLDLDQLQEVLRLALEPLPPETEEPPLQAG